MASQRTVTIGGVTIGGGNPVAIQSMCNTHTQDVEATVRQIRALETAGCQIVRVAVPDMEAAQAVRGIVDRISIPLVADIHFDWRLAVCAAENGVSKLRINPGNIGSAENVRRVVDAAKMHRIPIRIGVNSGSLEKQIVEKYGRTPRAMVESALMHLEILEKEGFTDAVVSIKASDVATTVEANRLMAKASGVPLHIGVTEAGTPAAGRIKSAIGIGTLLMEGIGDTVRVSLTGDPVNEIEAAKEILKACGLRKEGAEVISCPTCGRTMIDLETIADAVNNEVRDLDVPLTIAVMGCVVNGPGEASGADIGIAGGKDGGAIFKGGEILRTVHGDTQTIIRELMTEVNRLADERRTQIG